LSSWAAGEGNVRLAWIYHGKVQSDRYWVIDDVQFWALPGCSLDVSVSEVKCPTGVLSHGQKVQPAVFVWNHGDLTEEFDVRIRIGGYLFDETRHLSLYPNCDTFLEFDSDWTATPGEHAIVAFTNLAGDGAGWNDTATSSILVAGDSWVLRYGLGNDVAFGAALTCATEDSMFLLRGAAMPRKDFLLYRVKADLWSRKRACPAGFSHGADLVHTGGNYIYVATGSKDFFRYNISSNSWTTLAKLPGNVGSGGALAWGGGNYIYVMKGGGSKKFYRYSISSNSWTQMADLPDNVRFGGDLCWAGGDYIYAFRGNKSREFLRYSISGNTWTARASTPLNLPYVYKGASLAYDGTHNKIYATLGDQKYNFLMYDVATNTWTPVANTPRAVKTGGGLAYSDYSVFGIMGEDYTHDVFWRYSTGDTSQAPPPPPPDPPPLPPPPPPPEPGEIVLRQVGVSNPAYSITTGGRIAYLERDTVDEVVRLYAMDENGSNSQCLAQDFETELGTPTWTQDEEHVFVAGEDGLAKVSSDAQVGSSSLLDSGYVTAPVLSPDGEWVAYSKWDGNHKLYKMRVTGTDLACLTSGSEDYLMPRWSPDGMQLVCQRTVEGRNQIYIVDAVSGEEQAVTDDYHENTEPQFTADGNWIVFLKVDYTGLRHVYKVRPDGQDETALTEGEADHFAPEVSHDGVWVIFTTQPKDEEAATFYGCTKLEAVDVEGDVPVTLTELDAKRYDPNWAPTTPEEPYVVAFVEKLAAGDFFDTGDGEVIPHVRRLKLNLPRRPSSGARAIPKTFELRQNLPNPFRMRTSIRFGVPKTADVRVQVYDLTGRVVRTLADGERLPGYHSVVWNGEDNSSRAVAAGVYFYELKSDGRTLERKMLLLK